MLTHLGHAALMVRGQKQKTRRTKAPESGGDTADPINQAVARFSSKLVYGEVTDERRHRLVRLTPAPSPEIAARHPELDEVMRLAPAFLFLGTDLSKLEQQLVMMVLRKAGFSSFNVLLEVLSRIPRIEDQLAALQGRGVPRNDIIAALLMAPEELQRKATLALRRVKQRLGQQIGQLKTHLLAARKLKLTPELLESTKMEIEQKVGMRRTVQEAMDNFLRATRSLTLGIKTPLVRDPKVRLTQTLIDHDIPQPEAFRWTVDVLRAWDPERFPVSMNEMHIRQAYLRSCRALR